MTEHILDRPKWSSLTTRHAKFASGNGGARRFPTDITPFAGVKDDSDESLADLAALMAETGAAFVGQVREPLCPPGTKKLEQHDVVQMIGAVPVDPPRDDPQIQPLGEEDAPAMLALAKLTQPGPFEVRTHLLGRFWGVKSDGRLVAMAGERLKQPGFTEISGVCTHPDFRGSGYGTRLCQHVQRRIQDRGDTPYLHVFANNEGAISVYKSLGFKMRQHLYATLFVVADDR